jgi:creatinine amidohydrolase
MRKNSIFICVLLMSCGFLLGQYSNQTKGIELQYLTWLEAEEALQKCAVVVIPLGAITKEHGPHLPLNNDYLMAEYLAERVVQELEIVLMPTIPFGFYPAFLEYPGSVSLEFNTFKNLVKDMCKSLDGTKKFYILNTGYSTVKPLALAAKELSEESGIEMRYTDIQKVSEDVANQVGAQKGGGHADEIETSMMLYIKPEIVNMDKAPKDFHPKTGKGGFTRDPNKPGIYSPTGIWGDATLATRKKGEIVVEAMVKYIINDIEALMKK